MAKIILKFNSSKNSPNLLFIPGGPGLSPVSFDLLIERLTDFNCFYFYPTGTGGVPSTRKLYYDEQFRELAEEITKHETSFYICGHSFGGVLGAEIALQENIKIDGLICIAAPFRKETFEEVSQNFSKHSSGESEFDKEFRENPSDEIFAKWFASYAGLYFSKSNIENGKSMLLNDEMCVANYLGGRSEANKKEVLLQRLKKLEVPKLYLAGNDDLLMPVSVLSKDAMLGNFDYKVIKDAGHFVHFDNPSETAIAIQEFILRG